MVLEAIRYIRDSLKILDQKKLPHQEVYLDVTGPHDAWHAIQSMQVRGAPAIAIVAALSLAVFLKKQEHKERISIGNSAIECAHFISKSLKYLVTSRPTAVNLADAGRKLEKVAYSAQKEKDSSSSSVQQAYIDAAEQMLSDDVHDNRNIGRFGAEWIRKQDPNLPSSAKLSVLTHCNTGSLATAGYGTALGVVRALQANGSLLKAFYTETRPYNQGSRLTGFELIHDGIPATLITDSMAASLLQLKKDTDKITCIVVGADRVAANGDTANKIGTYSLAILARYHGIKFLVAAPRTTIDLSTPSGQEIKIEERPPSEVTSLKGPSIRQPGNDGFEVNATDVHEISIAAAGTHAWNPAFDVTPANLIDGIATEKGVVEKGQGDVFDLKALFDSDSDGETKLEANDAEKTSKHVDHLNALDGSITWEKALSLKFDQVPDWITWMQGDGEVHG